jgi:CRP-like cAMP-binding protein
MRKRSDEFDAEGFLTATGLPITASPHQPRAIIFSQGDPATAVLYLQRGSVQISVVSHTGKEAVIAVLRPQQFFGEGALAGEPFRLATARALTHSHIVTIPTTDMRRLLHEHASLSDRFIAHMVLRNARLEEDLVDQMFNSGERRLARTLLMLARFGEPDGPRRVLSKISQETLAEMVGTTRSRVNVFMNKFRKLGFIEYNGELVIHESLLTVVLHGAPK